MLSFPVEGGDERPAQRRADPFDLQVRDLGGDHRLPRRDRHLPRPPARRRAARASGRSHPPGYGTPSLGPITTALGEVYQFQVKAAKSPGVSAMELRTILDWFVAYQLRGVPGVTEINSHGGELKTYQVELDPDKLATYRLSMTEVFNALRSNNANVGGGYLVHEGGGGRPATSEEKPGPWDRRHRRDRHRRTQRRSRHGRQRRQGPPRSDDPGRPGDPRRPGRSSPAWS